MDKYSGYIIDKFKELIAIDSTTGLYEEIQGYLIDECAKLGYKTSCLHKGGVIADMGGEGDSLIIMSHADTIGLMVRHINSNGTLKVTNIGGLHAYCAERECVRINTRKNGIYSGTVQRTHSCIHVTPMHERDALADYDKNIVIVLDEDVSTADDVRRLGIAVGDIVSLEPRCSIINGYIKSRYIDDKMAIALSLGVMKAMKDERRAPARNVKMIFTMYEEIGHGGSWLPEGTKDIISIDVMCTGPEQTGDEHKVSLVAKDSRFPYHFGMLRELCDCAERNGIDFVIDVLTPSYGTDSDTALAAGHDVRHAALGFGTSATHGYERTHIDGVMETAKLILNYITGR